MRKSIRITTATVAVASLILAKWLGASAQVSRRTQAEELSFELQNESFSSLSWSIAEFKLLFSMRYGELLRRAQEFQRTLPPAERAVVSARIAEMLQETLAEAQTAIPVEAMREHLRLHYRMAGMTNPPAAASAEAF